MLRENQRNVEIKETREHWFQIEKVREAFSKGVGLKNKEWGGRPMKIPRKNSSGTGTARGRPVQYPARLVYECQNGRKERERWRGFRKPVQTILLRALLCQMDCILSEAKWQSCLFVCYFFIKAWVWNGILCSIWKPAHRLKLIECELWLCPRTQSTCKMEVIIVPTS